MTHREYCESQGFQFIRVAGGMFDLRRTGTPTAKYANLGRALDNEEGWAWAAKTVRAYVKAEGKAQSEAAGLLAPVPALDGRMDAPPLNDDALMEEVGATDDDDVPSGSQERYAEPETDAGGQVDT